MPNRVRIVRTRDTCGGSPRIAGTRATTRLLYVMWRDAGRNATKAAAWFDVPVEWVEAAVAYERHPWRRFCHWFRYGER